MAVFQVGPGPGREPHVDGHRLVVLLGQLVEGLIDGGGEPDFVVTGVKLDPAALLPLQVFLHLVGQVLRDGLPPPQHQAVQSHAVVEQVPGVVVEAHLQAPVAHDHSVDHAQSPVDLAEMIHGVHVAHLSGHGVGPGFGGEQMQMCVNDLHSGRLLSGTDLIIPHPVPCRKGTPGNGCNFRRERV